ncbi:MULTISPECIES: FAD-binding oxidoreductase [Thalassospira]|jgi:FAD/FMN-containing dehydrogenase|uniref:FAD-dependent oxidoreductase n=3 Tax=Thalassospira TaxID=168934 RepID=A0ABR5XZA4_9PROT|nr:MULTISPECIES: FAD-binding oxidoreductase [Thalassospira]MBL4839274.1 FAD-binding oxidoreductase [Thalassospira sp.]MBR9782043.1 FAD-binding oxidoreductase [Rhodospirillales bacterium]KZD01077.1 FAD-dependent oxidoreductase [Thalassospira xiamenensis]KZD06220.1 FAD-dependent oxidoreductase [Thalassospira xiamenensis]MBR9818149.1 FAD-binding oxidoreductase [Rhodospirillales bacterium]|tara:strand:+ start:791 stop:2227 length:1437 start_codon:yes stop_codon:yes gene_type:complete
MIDRLHQILGDKGLITDPQDMHPYLIDWRDRRKGKALCVALPANVEEVSRTMKVAAEERQPVFPLGGNTGLCYGGVPESPFPEDKPGIVISLQRMKQIREFDAAANIVTVDAGVILADLHEKSKPYKRQFPLYLGSEGSAQIGGLISTNAGGTGVVKYGPMRDLVCGIEVVLADGRILSDLEGLKKNNTGYDLKHLFIGAEGTLGIVTGAALRLHPENTNDAHAWVSVDSPETAVRLFTEFQDKCGPYIEAFELVSGTEIDAVLRHIERITMPFDTVPDWSLMIELTATDISVDLNSIFEEILGANFENGSVLDAFIASNAQQAKQIWHVRHSVTEANKLEGMGLVHDVAVRVSKVPAFIAKAKEVTAEKFPMATPLLVNHLGDGNVHYILMFPHDYWKQLSDPDQVTHDVQSCVHDIAASFGGTFSAEHGVGRKLTDELERLCDPLRYELMIGIKKSLDPENRMNPGVLFRNLTTGC